MINQRKKEREEYQDYDKWMMWGRTSGLWELRGGK